MSLKKITWFSLIFLFAVAACSSNEFEYSQESDEVMSKSALRKMEGEKAKRPSPNKQMDIQDRKIIKTGTIEFQTQDLSKARKQIDNAVKKYNGYISNEQESSHNHRLQQYVVIRVPAGKFDSLVEDVTKGVKKFDQKRIDASDVTEEFLDITARLKVKKETEQRYLQLLARAQSVKDILAIEEQIEELRSDIESIEGRLKYLNNQIAFSTLTVTFYEKISIPIGFAYKFKSGFKNGWNNFVFFLVGIVNIWPFILLIISGIFGIRFYIKRRKKKK